MELQELIETVKQTKPYFPTFKTYSRRYMAELDRLSGIGEISLAQYKQYKEELKDLKIQIPNLVYAALAPVMKNNFEFLVNVREVLNVRKFLDTEYGILKSSSLEDVDFVNTLLKDLASAITANNYEKAYDLFYFFNCWLRCHSVEEEKIFNSKIVASIYQAVILHALDEIEIQEVEALQVFGKHQNFKLNATAIAMVVNNTLLVGEEERALTFAAQVVSNGYRIGSTESILLIKDLAQVILHLCKAEDDLAELFKMVVVIKNYSNFSPKDVLGKSAVNKMIKFIGDYFESFDDVSCYSFLVSNQLYFSNATNAETIKKTKEEIHSLLSEYEILDYDKILDSR